MESEDFKDICAMGWRSAVYYGENKNKLNDLIISVRPHVFVRFEKVIFLRIYNTVDEIYRLMNF